MKSIPLSQFKLMKVPEIKQGGSFELTADAEFLAIVVVPISGLKKTQIEGLCGQMNLAMGIK